MTNEEAIKIIKAECYVFNPLNLDRTQMVNTALDRACEALEKGTYKQGYADRIEMERALRVEDCISRQAAIEAMGEQPLNWTDTPEEIAEEHIWKLHIKALEDLPPVTPQPKTGHWIDMGDFEKCSACNGTHLKEFQNFYGKGFWVKTKYCPNCGARMAESEGWGID